MNIAILSRGPELYSTQSLVRACVQQGHHVQVLDHMRCNLIIGLRGAQIHYDDLPLGRIDAVIPRIGNSVTMQGAAVISQFELMGAFTVARTSALLRARDKLRCLQLLAAEGIDVPRTAFIGEEQDIFPVIDRVGGLPVVVKLLESTHGVGVLLTETFHSVEATVRAFQQLGQRVIIQEFIREAGGADVRALVVAGRVVAGMKRQASDGEFRSNLHRGAKATPEQLSPEEETLALRATRAMGLDVAGVDLIRSRRGPLIMEVNASPGLEGIEKVTGVDVAGHIIAHIDEQVRIQRAASPRPR